MPPAFAVAPRLCPDRPGHHRQTGSINRTAKGPRPASWTLAGRRLFRLPLVGEGERQDEQEAGPVNGRRRGSFDACLVEAMGVEAFSKIQEIIN